MMMPTMTATRSLSASRSLSTFSGRPGLSMNVGVESESCSIGKAALCATALAVCGATCLAGPEVCIPCLASVGAPTCLSCLLG